MSVRYFSVVTGFFLFQHRETKANTNSIMKAYAGSPYIANTFSDFTPIEQLHRDDADVMLFFLSARGIVFAQPVDDPWFSAHREGPKSRNVMSGVSSPTYLQDEPVQVLGCTYQMQYCNPNYPDHSRCSPLAGYVDDRVDVTQLYDNEAQKRMFNWTVDVFQLGFFSISGIVDSMGVSSLVGRQGLSANQQGPLPSNQWQTEVEHWTGGSLASIQGSFVEMGNGPPSPVYQRFRKAPENAEQKQVCKSMVSHEQRLPICPLAFSDTLVENYDNEIFVFLRPWGEPDPPSRWTHHAPRPHSGTHIRLLLR